MPDLAAPAFRRTKYACFYTYLAMASVFSLPPLLFTTFHERYGVSFTLLGTLVLVNYITQFLIDLTFTFFAKHFNIKFCIRLMPLLTTAGLSLFALIPYFFPAHAYLGLVLGTVVYSAAAGLNEVLLSPMVAALPSKNPQRDMSTLHSLYAYGVLTVILISTLFFRLIGQEHWIFLTLFFAALPIVSFLLFCFSPLPNLNLGGEEEGAKAPGAKRKPAFLSPRLFLFTLCIFLGSAAENTMTNWISGYFELVLGLDKTVGDLVGMALFITLLGLTRTVYAKWGKRIYPVLLGGMIGAFLCYLAAGLSPWPILSLVACVLTGIFTSMLWPGMLIFMEENTPHPGVAAYALLAAGGDFGASVAPQLLGILADHTGLQNGMLVSSLFPLAGAFLLFFLGRHLRKQNRTNP